jgi:uncharacterized membrane protein YgdD (TMEM256/DUF423 family)
MQKLFLIFASISAALSVVLGAFGAHALRAKLPADQLAVFETGVRYQMYHALALIAIAILFQNYNQKLLTYAGVSFIAGIILFSGSLYLLSTRELLTIENWKWLGPLTPLGGFAFISGWILILLAIIKKG